MIPFSKRESNHIINKNQHLQEMLNLYKFHKQASTKIISRKTNKIVAKIKINFQAKILQVNKYKET